MLKTSNIKYKLYIMYTIKLTIPCQYNDDGYTYAPYEFSYNLSPEYEHNNKLIMLIHDEIRKLSFQKLEQWKNSKYSQNGNILNYMPNTYIYNIGQIATNNILQKCKSFNDINNLYENANK